MLLKTTFPRRVWFRAGTNEKGKDLWASREPTKEDREERVEIAVSLGMDRTIARIACGLSAELSSPVGQKASKASNSHNKIKSVLKKLSREERDRLLSELTALTVENAA